MINQLFDINAIRQNVQDVSAEVEKIRQNLQTLSVKVKIELPSDIQTQINSINSAFSSINSSLGEITAGQLRYAKAMTEGAKQATESAKQAKLYAQAKKQSVVTDKEVTAVLGVQARTMAEAAEQNRILRAAAKQLDLTQEDNIATLKTYNQQIEANTEFIRANSDAQVKQKMNIGNYNSVWKGLNTSVQQLVREMPAAKYGLDIFFLAISNNIPILMDSINAMREYNKEMVKTGQLDKKVSIGKELLKSLISWQTALMIGITLLVQYGEEIVNWVANLFKGEKALNSATIAQEALNNAWKDGTKNAQSELTELRLLTKAIGDNSTSLETRKRAVDKLRESYPDYLGNLTDEEILAGKVGDAYNKIATGIMQASIAKAKMKEMTTLAEQLVDMQAEDDFLKQFTTTESVNQQIAEAEAEYNRAVKKRLEGLRLAPLAEKLVDMLAENGVLTQSVEQQIEEEEKEYIRAARKRLDGLRSILPILEAMEKLAENIDVGALLDAEDGNGAGGKTTTDNYDEILAKLIGDATIKSIKEKRERELAEIEKWYKEQLSLIENRGGEYAEREAQALKSLNDARETKIQEANDKYIQEIEREGKRLATAYNKMLQAGLRGMDNTYSAEQSITKVQMLEEQAILNEKYNKNIINENQYQKEMLALQQKYAREAIDTQINYVQFELDLAEERRQGLLDSQKELQAELLTVTDNVRKREIEEALSGIEQSLLLPDLTEENIQRLKSLLAELSAELSRLLSLQNKENKDRKKNESTASILGIDEDDLKVAEAIMQGVSDIMGEIDNLVNTMYEARLEKIEKETEAVEKSHERQLDSLQNLYEQGAISQEEYEARKRLQEQITEQKKEALAKKESELRIKQAKYDKAQSIAQALINVALGITSALTLPFPLSTIQAAIVGAMGAIQVATIMATPLPTYAKGTKYHKGGLAVVGDGGKQEVVMTDKGAFLTPDTPTIMNLPRGAKVFPDIDLLNPDDIHFTRQPFSGLSYDENGQPIIINDYSALEKEQRLTRKELERHYKMMKKAQLQNSLNRYKMNTV